MKTRTVFFPFDLFGSSGTRAGVELLHDAFEEMLADNRRERIPTRARAYAGKVRFEEVVFDKLADYADWQDQARRCLREAWPRDFLLWVTGNHLGALPLYEELGRQPGSLVIQFDAHLDIFNLTDNTTELSHGNFLLHCPGPLPAIINVGHRELLLRPDYIAEYYEQTFPASDLAIDPGPCLEKVTQACHSAERVFLDIDCDVFDPAFFPAASHPQPFGLSPQLFLKFLAAAWSERVIGLSLSEFDPARDLRDQSLATLIWLVEFVLLKRHERKR